MAFIGPTSNGVLQLLFESMAVDKPKVSLQILREAMVGQYLGSRGDTGPTFWRDSSEPPEEMSTYPVPSECSRRRILDISSIGYVFDVPSKGPLR